MTNLSLAQLRHAVSIKERIDGLQVELSLRARAAGLKWRLRFFVGEEGAGLGAGTGLLDFLAQRAL